MTVSEGLNRARRERWLRETHERTDRCRPCGLNEQHCDTHGKRFAPDKEDTDATD